MATSQTGTVVSGSAARHRPLAGYTTPKRQIARQHDEANRQSISELPLTQPETPSLMKDGSYDLDAEEGSSENGVYSLDRYVNGGEEAEGAGEDQSERAEEPFGLAIGT